MSRKTIQKHLIWPLLALCMLGLTACPSIGEDEPVDYGPYSIYNPDWNVLPLANNFLNGVQQAEIPVAIPGVAEPDMPPTTVALPVLTEEDALAKQDLGYLVEPDSPTTLDLVAGMNKLDGFVENFVIRIPFSAPVDMDSLVPFEATLDDGVITESNADTANFFFMDVTDPEKPVPFGPTEYSALFNYEMVDADNCPFFPDVNGACPYYLTLRLSMADIVPVDYTPGHTYLIVVTGIDADKGLKGLDGKPFYMDGNFLVFAGTTPYIAPDGSARNNLLTGIENIQEAEGARQITDWGLKIWESVVGEARGRNEVITAFHYTITSNPYPKYMNAIDALQANKNAFTVEPIDYIAYDEDDEMQEHEADACPDTAISFKFNLPIDADTVNSDSVKLFTEDLSEVAVDIKVEKADSKPVITLTPKSDLKKNTTYLVAVSNGVTGGENSRPAIDQSYFGLTRVTAPLISQDDQGEWRLNSPHLDSRIDAFLAGQTAALFKVNGTDANKAERAAALEGATATAMKILRLLEKMRLRYKPYIDDLAATDFVTERADLALFWTFTTNDGNGCD